MNANSLTKNQLRSNRVERLMRMVQSRKRRLAKQNYEEKLEAEFSPYTLVHEIPRIERLLFFKKNHLKIDCIAALRDRYGTINIRFCLLMTSNGILRGESLIKSDLSDLCDIVVEGNSLDKAHIFVMRITSGKTNGLKTLYGRSMRHKDVTLCSIGALALYLLARFEFGGETIDFSSNETWFDVKLLVEKSMANHKKAITDQYYAKSIRNACASLGIVSKHFVHFGRSVGAVQAEMYELDGSEIKVLGNWNPDTQEDRYSSKLPLKALRVMAGHSAVKNQKLFLPRSEIEPPIEIQKKLFPFIEETEEALGKALLHRRGDFRTFDFDELFQFT
jgi:hypothetical protein